MKKKFKLAEYKSRITLAILLLSSSYSICSFADSEIKFNDIPKNPQGITSNEIVIEGQSITSQDSNYLTIQGQNNSPAQIWYQDKYIQGNNIDYNFLEDKVTISNNAVLKNKDILVQAPKATYEFTSEHGEIENAKYQIVKNEAHGTAQYMDLEKNSSTFKNVTYSTCSPDAMDWYIQAQSLNVDSRNNDASARNAKLIFLGIPVLATPYFGFSLNNQRRSGFLVPSFGVNSRTGVDLTIPYYFNIAPQHDLTIYPRILSRRGFLFGGEFRYLREKYKGRILGEYLPKDSETKEKRWAILLEHEQIINPWLIAYADVERVSDASYPDDFGKNLSEFTKRLFTQEVGLKASKDFETQSIQGLIRYKNHQTIADIAPYNLVPQFNVLYNKQLPWNFEFSAEADASYFRHTALLDGKRVFSDLNLSTGIDSLAYYVKPNIRLHSASYWLDNNNSYTKTIPTFSIDSALFFDRKLKNQGKQTIEPRLFYTYTPYRNQDNIPLFDTTDAEFGLHELFSNNRFVGHDRIGDANQLTAGITSRWLDNTGNEKSWITLGQRYQFNDTKVNLNNKTLKGLSDIIIQGGWNPNLKLNLSGDIQYNPDDKKLVKFTSVVNWTPQSNKSLGLGYRYREQTDATNNTPYKQITFSSGWQFHNKWKINSQIGYDLQGKALSNAFIGIDYLNDCWQMRSGLDRVVGSDGKYTTRAVFQIALKGLGNGLK